MKVLTLNVWAGNYGMDLDRLRLQIERVQALNCDIICLQEAFATDVLEMYRNAFPGHVLFAGNNLRRGTLLRPLQLMAHAIPSRNTRQLFASDNTLGLVMLIRSELNPVLQCCRKFEFQAVPRTLVGAVEKYAIPRGIMVCTIEWDGETVAVANIHLNTGKPREGSGMRGGINPQRKEQLTETIEELAKHSERTIICGDFNADADTQTEMLWFYSADGGKQIDTYATVHGCWEKRREQEEQGATWCSRNPHTIGWMVEEDQRIDLINLSQAMLDICTISDSCIVLDTEPWVTDHFALTTVLDRK